jgi:hypothetical protein
MNYWGLQHLSTKGHAYGYFVIEDVSDEWKLSISTNSSSFNIYASFGAHANPNRFNHEMAFLNIPANKEIELTDKQFYGHQDITVAFEILGFDEPTHTAHNNKMTINAQKGNGEMPLSTDNISLTYSDPASEKPSFGLKTVKDAPWSVPTQDLYIDSAHGTFKSK